MTVKEKLPQYIDPFRLADSGIELNGSLNLATMERLQELVSNQQGEVEVHLVCGRDSEKHRMIKLFINAKVSLICQRCLKPMPYLLNTESLLSPVVSESHATNLSKEYEPLVTHGEPILLSEIVEDEILLNLPMIPKHPEICSPDLPQFVELR